MTLDRAQQVREQYRDPSNFGARVALHARFSTNPYRFPRFAFDQIGVGADAEVLEVGCGTGILWRENIERVPSGWRIVATDMSAGMIADAKSALDDGRFSFLVADAQMLPFAPGSFDAVVANHMLYHVPDLDAAFGEFDCVLRSGGRLIAATNGVNHMAEIRDILGKSFNHAHVFGLESGEPKIAAYFGDVKVDRHPNTIDATEVEPVLDYIRSMSTFRRIGEQALEPLRARVEAAIERDGYFRITTDAGVITGTKR